MNMWEEWKEKIEIENGYAMLMYTDRFDLDRYPLSEETEKYLSKNLEVKLLDMRIFNKKSEFRLFRGDVGRDLKCRVCKDEGRDFYEDEQYLDIDDIRSGKCFEKEGVVRATGGGYYRLPLESYKDVKVIIKNYVDYDKETGQAYIKDWRLAGFVTEKEV